MSKKVLGRLLLGIWVLGGATPASASGEGALTLLVENDVFTNSDNNYTNGVGVAWVSGAVAAEDSGFVGHWTRWWSFLPYVADDGYATYASWSLAQEMNTPDDITDPDPSPDDQPYSGILYVDSTLYARKPNWTHAWQLKLGVVGPASQAEVVQRDFHRLIGAGKPRGWDTVAHLAAAGRVGRSAQWRVVPVATVGVGNYFTGAGGGVYGEVGWDLVDALGVTALRSGLNAASTVGVVPRGVWSVSLFGGAGAYAVAHYMPLDGTLFRDSRSVDSKPVIAMGSFGFCLRRGGFTLSFARTFFSNTFDTQRERTDFGTLAVSWAL
jgi:hypothetical protein